MDNSNESRDKSKIDFSGYRNTILAYKVELDDFLKRDWVLLDILEGAKSGVQVYLLGYPDANIKPRPFEKLYMENERWKTPNPAEATK